MRHFLPLIFLFVFSASQTVAQNCGCADEGNCPFSVPNNSTTQVCYEITDAFNNNLADPSQGVCGVELNFQHQFIADLDLTLTSPGGQSVQLTGTTGSCSNFSILANWDVLFIPCAEACAPDTLNGCPMPCQWDNCPTGCLCSGSCNWPNANIAGEYYPYSGCLEDFNFGPANGQWCLEINNGAPFNGGAILDFEVILCDQSGFMCCDADAGNLAFEPDVNACEGDAALLLTPEPMYGAITPDTADYDYTYIIFSNGEIAAYDSLTNLTSFSVGTYEVCGLSYLESDVASLPVVGTTTSASAINANLMGPTPDFCGDIETNCITVTISTPPPPANLIDTICMGDTLWIGTEPFTQTGIFADTLESFGGCDSIVNLDLLVLEPDTTELIETICFGETFTVGSMDFDMTGEYEVTLTNQFSCDSLVMLDLTVLNPIDTSIMETICEGDTIWIGTEPYTQTGIWLDTIASFFNCDSAVSLDLTVVELTLSIDIPDTLDCETLEVGLSANATTSLGTLNYFWLHNTPPGTGIVNGVASPTPNVNLPGEYVVNISSTPTGCTLTDTIEVIQDVSLPTANPVSLPPSILTCDVTSVTLDGSGSISGSGPLEYEWTGGGLNETTETVSINEPGTYLLTVTDMNNACLDTMSVSISQDTISPSANAGLDGELSCTIASLTLDGSGSTSPSGSIEFSWTANPGNILPPANIFNPMIDEPGTYILTVTNPTNGCTDIDSVIIDVDNQTPVAIIDIPGPDSLTCVVDTVFLDASGSLNTTNATFEWIGNIAGGQGTDMAIVTEPGTVSLVVFDTVNGCSDTTTVSIIVYEDFPSAEAGPGGELDCGVVSIDLDGSASSFGATIEYEWTSGPGGSFNQPINQAITTVDSAAIYYLTVTESVSGCTAIDSVEISENFTLLNIILNQPDTLDCETFEVLLDGSASTLGGFIQEEWLDDMNNVISTQPTVLVDGPGTYYFTLEVGLCNAIDSVEVILEAVPPSADAGPDQVLDCETGQAVLDGTGSTAGANITYEWSSADGNILPPANEVTATVDAVGTYVLTVSDAVTGCTAIDTALVTLDTAACLPSANAGADGVINCFGDPTQTTLSASGSMGANISYGWFTISPPPAEVIDQSDPFAPVVTAGTFVFAVTNDAVDLTVFDTVLVVPDTMAPLANVVGGPTLELTCPELSTCFALDVSGTSVGPEFTYFWDALDGEICTDPTELNTEVLGAGIYSLQVTDTSNGCDANVAVFVQLADVLPTSEAGDVIQMECGATDTILMGEATPLGGNLVYEWLSPSGNISNGGNTLSPTVSPNNPSDTFFLVVSNLVNLCQDTDFVVVFAPVNCAPMCNATASGPIGCLTDTVSLLATGSSTGTDISYQWTAITGNLCGGATDPTACADQPGIYELTVTRTYPNGASFDASCQVQVFDETDPPLVDAGPDGTLTCIVDSLELDGSNSATGADIIYQWTANPGNILSGANTTSPVVDAPGTYELLVTDTLTGCTATDFTVIDIDTISPMAEAGPDGLITCGSNQTTLNGSANPATVTYAWTTNDGNICGNGFTPNPSVCAEGTYYLTVTNPLNGCTDIDSTFVDADDDVPDVNVGPDLEFTCVDTSFIIDASASGVGPLSFSWVASNGGCIVGPSNILQITVNCPGTYTLTVSDLVSGCSAFGLVEINDNTEAPVADAGSDMEINCQNLTVELDGSGSTSASGSLEYSWTVIMSGNILPPANEETATADQPGTYQLLVTDPVNGCVDSTTVIVTEDGDIPTADAGPDTTLTCVRLELDLDGTGSSVDPDILYSWMAMPGNIKAGETTLTPTIDAVGTYILTVTDTGSLCVVLDTVVVTEDLSLPIPIIDPTANLVVSCAEPQITLNGSSSLPTGNVSAEWTTFNGNILPPVNALVVNVDEGGNYTLIVTHGSTGCIDSTNVTVTEDLDEPFVQVLDPEMLTCDSTTITLFALPPDNQPIYEFQWDGPGIVSGGDNPNVVVDETGLYGVTITDTTNGCQGDSSIIVTADFSLPTAVANTIGQLDCDNLTALVTGEGSTTNDVTYEWTTTSPGNIFTPNALNSEVDAPGWYFFTVKKLDNGCTATDSTQVTASSLPIDEALISLEQPTCDNPEGFIFIDSVLGGTAPYFYSLDGAASVTYAQFSYLPPGAYEVTVEDLNGCSWTTQVSILFPNEILVELGADLEIREGESTILEALVSIPETDLASITWTGLADSTDCPNCLIQEVMPEETTTYRIFLVDSTGCRAEDAVTVFVDNDPPFYVPTAFSPNGDNVNDRLILYSSPDVLRVPDFRIFDRWGNMVFQQEDYQPNNPNFGWDGKFEGLDMNPAVFVWKAEVELVGGIVEVFYGEVSLVR